ncbi:26.2 kDa heat shock protein mitochondrial [Phtheirospermum japonicum]|uniref:26.2 kDa heat shock protein mitochondrial n=1 Tax=Phtheirospermum japonicum TaxID=374723 RepID=A0A830C851_9LAMI|nr:26.2 kDa heat shock protein mitochondrial [Phtheirospermum japonicum]
MMCHNFAGDLYEYDQTSKLPWKKHILKISLKCKQRDIAAPRVHILAAFTKFTTMIGSDSDKRVVKYNAGSGNSMATPHVSGSVAYIKTYHLSRHAGSGQGEREGVGREGGHSGDGRRKKDFKDDEFGPRYTNSIQLPQIALLNNKAIKAEMVNGVLKVFVPKLKVEERTDVLLPIPVESWNNFISRMPFARCREAVITQGMLVKLRSYFALPASDLAIDGVG